MKTFIEYLEENRVTQEEMQLLTEGLQEEWTQAPQKAPFMATDQTQFALKDGRIRLVDEESTYGWKWYSIEWSE